MVAPQIDLTDAGTGSPPPTATRAMFALKTGDSFAVCDAYGDISGEGDGLFRNDTRMLSRLVLDLGGMQPSLLSGTVSHDNVFFTANLSNRPLPPLGGPETPAGVIHVQRTRFLWANRLFECITCVNYDESAVSLPLRLHFDADFHDIFEVRGNRRARRGTLYPAEVDQDCVMLSYLGLDEVLRRTVIAFSMPPAGLCATSAQFTLALPPRGMAELYLEVGDDPTAPCRQRFRDAAAHARKTMRRLRRRGARPLTNARLFNAWLDRSRADIALLVSELRTGPYPYAGIPWFSTPFGRDAIITSLADAVARSEPGPRRARLPCAQPVARDLRVSRLGARQDHARDAQGRNGGAARSAVRAVLRRRRHHAAVRDAGRRVRRAHRRPGVHRLAVARADRRDGLDRAQLRPASGRLSHLCPGDEGRAGQSGLEGQRRFRLPRRRQDSARADRAGRGAGLRVCRLARDGAAWPSAAASHARRERWRARAAAMRIAVEARFWDEDWAPTASRWTATARCAACAPPTSVTCSSSDCHGASVR